VGRLAGTELNAADFQIAPNIALQLRFADRAPSVANRPAARLGQLVAPDHPRQIGALLPTPWLASLHPTTRTRKPDAEDSPDVVQAIGRDARATSTLPCHDSAPLTHHG